MILMLISMALAGDTTTLSLRRALELAVERNPELKAPLWASRSPLSTRAGPAWIGSAPASAGRRVARRAS